MPGTLAEGRAPSDLIVVRGLQKRYGGVQALRGAALDVRAGEVHALVGENGAGKSTLARILAGVTRADAGDILLDGVTVSLRSPRDAQRLGIGIVYQELDLFPHLTVAENIVIENHHFPEGWRSHPRRMAAFCRGFLADVGLSCDVGELAGSLSIGQKQLLAIARALSMNARLIILDEPTSALSHEAADRLFTVIRSLTARGVAIIYVSHRMEEILSLSDRATVLRDGVTVATRPTATITADEIIRLMVGRPVDHGARSSRGRRPQVVLAARHLTTRKLRDVSFDLHAGEVLGIAGLMGAGRSALGATLYGMDTLAGGELEVCGRRYAPRDPANAMRQGLGLVPEDRQSQGLMMHMSVRENGTLSVLTAMSRAGFVWSGREAAATDAVFSRVALTCASPDAPVGTLSGGNQQKALLARVILADPDVLFLDDPTRGVDVGAKEDIRRLIDEMTARGKGVLLVSSDLSELLQWCDRILVLADGRLARVYEAREATPELIMAAATRQGAA